MTPGDPSEKPLPEVAVHQLPPRSDSNYNSARHYPGAADGNTELLLGRNAIWFCRLRWIVVAVLGAVGLLGILLGFVGANASAIGVEWPLSAAGLLAAANFFFERQAAPHPGRRSYLSVRWQLWGQIITDLLVLTAVIYWLGDHFPAAPFMYLFHIILACIAFKPVESLMVAVLAAGCHLSAWFLEWRRIIPAMELFGNPPVIASQANSLSNESLNLGLTLLIWLVIWYLVSRLAGTLIQRDEELALTNFRLKASIEERADHMLQTTHQLKAPFAAIHAQTQILLGNYCGELHQQARVVVEKMASRCLSLSRQIQEMLQLANLRSQGQTILPAKKLDLAEVVAAAVTRIEPAARQRGIAIEQRTQSLVLWHVEDHLTMLMDNLLGNAVNYSFDQGHVEITCEAEPNGQARLVVRDYGIGIPGDKLPHVFEDYYRTDEAVRHNRASTGLGLAIVRHVAEEAGLAVRVESAPGWGTRFTVSLPPSSPHSPLKMQLNHSK